jgi:hypothetical protein
MKATNLFYGDLEHTQIGMDVTLTTEERDAFVIPNVRAHHPLEFGFFLHPDDQSPLADAVRSLLSGGGYTIAPYEPPPPPEPTVPVSVTPRQCRLALLQAGLLDAAEAAVGSINPSDVLLKSGNLAGLADAEAARANLGLHAVAASGSYEVLDDKPTLFSGSYNDLADKPTIPAAQVNADWNAVSGVAQILNKPTIPSPGQPIPTGAPSTWAVGTRAQFEKNGSGTIAAGASISGSSLRHIIVVIGGSGPFEFAEITFTGSPTGTWMNISGISIGNHQLGDFVRTA